jgi:transcriptional regulator with XRE-family HTH domain
MARAIGLKEAREASGLSLRQLGRETGLQSDLISSYEHGRRTLHKKDAAKLGRVLKMQDSLEIQIENAQRKFQKAMDADKPQDALKAAGRLITLAEEAEESEKFSVDWQAFEDLVEGLAEQISGGEDDDDEEEASETDEDKKLKRPASKKGRGRDDDEDEDMDRDPFGRRIHKDSDGPATEDDGVDEDGLNTRDPMGRKLRKEA